MPLQSAGPLWVQGLVFVGFKVQPEDFHGDSGLKWLGCSLGMSFNDSAAVRLKVVGSWGA